MTRRVPKSTPRRDAKSKRSSADEVRDQRRLYADDEPEPEPEPPPAVVPRRYRQDLQIEMLRVPPQSIESEQAVLGAIMLVNEAFATVRSRLSVEDFYRRDHQMIYRAMIELFEKDVPLDAVTLAEWFEAQGLAENVAGGAYLVELASTTPSAANVDAYANIVEDKAVLRRLIQAGTGMVNAGFHPEGRDVDEILSASISDLEACHGPKEIAGQPSKQGMVNLYADIQHRYIDEGPPAGVVVPYECMSQYWEVFEPEAFYGIAGRAKMGKSIVLGNIETTAALKGFKVASWSIEMGELDVNRRRLSSVSGVDFMKLKKPKLLDDQDWAMLQEGIRLLRDAQITTFYEPVVTIEKIGAQAAMLKAKGLIDIAVIDYLQIVNSEGRERRDLDIGHVSIGMKRMAKRLRIPVIAGMQINRGNEKAGTKVRPPRASDLRESGNLEQDVDGLLTLHRPGYYDANVHGAGCRAEVVLNRNGETGVFRLEEDLAKSRFLHSNRPWYDHELVHGEKPSRADFD